MLFFMFNFLPGYKSLFYELYLAYKNLIHEDSRMTRNTTVCELSRWVGTWEGESDLLDLYMI
jgi:hypothetical protein